MEKKRTNFIDIANLALLYKYEHDGGNMLKYDSVSKFNDCINESLDNIGSKYYYVDEGIRNNEIYFFGYDENGERYLILNPNLDIKNEVIRVIGNTNTDVLKVSRFDDTLLKLNIILQHNYKYKKKMGCLNGKKN